MRNRFGTSRRQFVKTTIAVAVATVNSEAAAQPAGMIRGFDHVALPMQNTEAMVAFYRALGVPIAETANAVSVYFGEQMINFHRPTRWQNPAFTLRARPRNRRAAISVSCGTAHRRSCGISLIAWAQRSRLARWIVWEDARRPAPARTCAIQTGICWSS
jgi:hypothetical protein